MCLWGAGVIALAVSLLLSMPLEACERTQATLERQVHAKAAGRPSKRARASVERVCVAAVVGD